MEKKVLGEEGSGPCVRPRARLVPVKMKTGELHLSSPIPWGVCVSSPAGRMTHTVWLGPAPGGGGGGGRRESPPTLSLNARGHCNVVFRQPPVCQRGLTHRVKVSQNSGCAQAAEAPRHLTCVSWLVTRVTPHPHFPPQSCCCIGALHTPVLSGDRRTARIWVEYGFEGAQHFGRKSLSPLGWLMGGTWSHQNRLPIISGEVGQQHGQALPFF